MAIVEGPQGAGVTCRDEAQERLVRLGATDDAEQRGEEHGLRAIPWQAQGCNPGRHESSTGPRSPRIRSAAYSAVASPFFSAALCALSRFIRRRMSSRLSALR